MATSFDARKVIFVLTTVTCLGVAVLYTLFSTRTAHREIGKDVAAPTVASSPGAVTPVTNGAEKSKARQVGPTPRAAATPDDRVAKPIHAKPYLVAINLRHSPDLGKAEFSDLDTVEESRTATDLRCERLHFSGEKGICLRREIRMFSAQTVATLVDGNFQPVASVRSDGIPSRARLSPDGRYAAFTVFLTGHSYGDAQMSTATLLLNAETGGTVANLEEFKVLQDGNVIKALDFNFWGVTFQHDSNMFYATLRTGGTNYLVHGDINARALTVVYQGVECPSLSPDEKRIAFKKMISRNNWRLTVLDLSSLTETPLAETRSVDDQPEWLDNGRVLYAMVDPSPWMSVMVVPSDGSGQPSVFARGATSPAVVRWTTVPPGTAAPLTAE